MKNTQWLGHANQDNDFHVQCDSSDYAIGAVLIQEHEKDLVPIELASQSLDKNQLNWHVSEKELFKCSRFIVYTDHKNLQQLLNKSRDFKSGKLFRWAVRLQDHQFKCTYIRGKDNVVADYLSRDSILIQHPQYDLVRDFYNANPNPIRQYLSNTDGVDIVALYMRHLDIETLNMGTIGHYLPSHRDPFMLLVQNNELSHVSDTKLRNLLDKTDHYLSVYETDHTLPRQYAEWHDGFETDPAAHYSYMLA